MTLEEVFGEFCYLKSYKGYFYLVSCVQRVYEDGRRLCRIREQVYLPVARAYGVSIENLERNLRTIRDAILSHGGCEMLNRHLGSDLELPLYPRELIGALAECMHTGKR